MNENSKQELKALNACVIIPTYNNEKTLATVISEVREYTDDLIVVNDGSTDTTSRILSQFPDIVVCAYPDNKGKGHALRTGFQQARSLGFDYALTIDSDGQHFPSDIPLFTARATENPDVLLVGARNLQQENMPGKNSFANKFSNFWFKLETGKTLSDTQSGFRWYPLQAIKDMRFLTRKYDFELEVLVRSAWKGIPVHAIPIRVFYAPEGERVSHFKPVRDFTRISLLNTYLVLMAFLWVKPFAFLRSLTKENIRRFLREQVLASPDSNRKISLSIALGVLMGIVPVWGYQMLIAFALAHFFRLNKVITLVASNISIPPMIPFILFGSFAVGAWVLGRPLEFSLHEINFGSVRQDLWQYIVGSCVLAVACALLAGALSGLLLGIFRKKGGRR